MNTKMHKEIKRIVYGNRFVYGIYEMGSSFKKSLKAKGGVQVVNNGGFARIKKDIAGCNNTVVIGNNATLQDTAIVIHGDNNIIRFG